MKLINAIMFFVLIVTCIYNWYIAIDEINTNYAITGAACFLLSIIFFLFYILEEMREENQRLKRELIMYNNLLHETLN
jgi:hypothetical protein